jgi:class 3 adenylate cyclase/tetratricopeptide (TPR) repeat protein
MRCAQCQQENPPGARFCNRCGAELPVACAACRHVNVPGSRFCGQCGRPLGAAPGSPPAERYTSPESYTPHHLAERILTSRSALEGERKLVTVLFADLKGSLELLADRDPEEARKLLDPVLDRMMEAVHRYEGTVNQVLGDGVMALFGAPLAHEDHALRACFAALRMQEVVTRYGDEIQRSQGIPLQIRVGLNSGDVVVRSIGSDLHMDYTAVGQTTHLAARLEQMAKPGSTLLTAETLRLTGDRVRVRPLGRVPVRGLSAPVEVFELTGARTAPSPLGQRTGVASPFVGRDPELARLGQALAQAAEGRGQAVAIVGEPGVGKSRLVFEFTRSPGSEGWLRLEASAVSYGADTPYLLAESLLRGYFELEDGEPVERAREKVSEKVLTLDARLGDAVSALLSVLDVLPDEHPARTLDAARRRTAVQDAVKRVLLRETQRQPLLLVLENLHWIDADSRTLLDRLMDSLPSARLLLVLSYRPEFQHDWANRRAYTQVRLDPLPSPSASRLLRALVGDDPSVEPVTSLLVRRTAGNPLFLEEGVRALVETGALAGERGAYRLTRALQAVQVPSTIQALLAARIDRLAPDDKRLLQAASVVGTDVPFPVLAAIADLPEEALRPAVARLQAAELLAERTLFPEVEYTFRHALIHEVAYGNLLQDQRRALHAKIVTAIETVYAERLAEWRDRLAHHVARGEVWHKSLAYFRPISGTESPVLEGSAWWVGDYDRARHRAETDLLVGDAYRSPLQFIGRLRLAQAHHARGDYARAIEPLRQNVALLEGELLRERFDMPAAASVLSRVWLAWCLAETGELGEAERLGREALTTADGSDDACGGILARAALGLVRLTRGDLDAATTALESGLARARGDDAGLVPFLAAPLGYVHARAGRPAAGLPLFDEAEQAAERTRLAAGQPLRLAWRAEAEARADLDPAPATAERAVLLARERGERGNEAHALRARAEVARRRGDAGGAATGFREALELASALGMRPLADLCRQALRAGGAPA